MEKLWTREDELEFEALVQLGLQSGQVEECHSVYLSKTSSETNKMKACMIGAAMIGKFGDKDEAFRQHRNAFALVDFSFNEADYIHKFSEMLGVNKHLLLRASYRHMAGITIDRQLSEIRANCYN